MDNINQYLHSIPCFNQDRSLLIQFILFELEQARTLLNKAQKLVTTMKPTRLNTCSKKDKEHLQSIENLTKQLAGSFFDPTTYSSWNMHLGVIRKLHLYCVCFDKYKKTRDLSTDLLKDASKKTVKSLNIFIKHLKIKTPYLPHLISSLEDIHTQLKTISFILTEILPLFKDNANVLFYLLKNHDKLHHLWDFSYLKDFFKHLFPSGKTEVEHFLKSKYNIYNLQQIDTQLSKKIHHLLTYV